ncbi:MAG: hypothetical protein EXR71_12265 [Myxococcales bacterium]|nr:hypothetical protein [Myxococcales bacterium]
MTIFAPASVGDGLDRLTILAHKRARAVGAPADNVSRELAALLAAWTDAGLPTPESVPEFGALDQVNRQLWATEDRLRAAEAAGQFGPGFVEEARAVYRLNDRRAAIKRAVNIRYGSALVEEKLHPHYETGNG